LVVCLWVRNAKLYEDMETWERENQTKGEKSKQRKVKNDKKGERETEGERKVHGEVEIERGT